MNLLTLWESFTSDVQSDEWVESISQIDRSWCAIFQSPAEEYLKKVVRRSLATVIVVR